ncbi:MAG: hypothetical protein M0P71_01780 [Melioribacteraceae bacterium]|nr:hypothetical protein [Melioribacteraceae bacterium]
MDYGKLCLVVIDKFGKGEELTDICYGIRLIVPSNPPRLSPPSFEGQSIKTGLFVRVSIFKRKMAVFGSKNNNPDTDVSSMNYIQQKQNEAMRNGNAARFVELSNILANKLNNPKKIKYTVEKFIELKCVCLKGDWTWCNEYGLVDLTEDPKSSNTLYPAPADVLRLEDASDFHRGYFQIKDIPETEHRDIFFEQFKPTEKAKRQERGMALGNLWQLVKLDTVNDLEEDPNDPNYVDAKNDFPEPEFFTDLIGEHPEMAFTQIDECYSELFSQKAEKDGFFSYGYIIGAAQLVADGKELFVNCDCGRSEKGCHCTWLKNKITEIARIIKSKQLNQKGI